MSVCVRVCIITCNTFNMHFTALSDLLRLAAAGIVSIGLEQAGGGSGGGGTEIHSQLCYI